ncbi:MAG: DUF1499 domain-containing protein, partial [Rhizobiales bacterium]|nr:DUF1499 domain-containing protein [Hyphomicrobiales bacterium]
MVRRLPLEEPPSRLAMWSLRLALFALAVALLSIILVRGSFVETIPGLAVLAGGLLIASVGLLTGLSAFFVIWRNGNPGFTRAIVGMAVSVALIAYPTLIVARTYHLPPIADVTTAPDDPPQFEVIARVRPRAANPVAYPAANSAMEREGYPEIAPLQYSATPADVFRAV